jgi:protein-S-isoprenylcysteine O-methyltransferase Ste14
MIKRLKSLTWIDILLIIMFVIIAIILFNIVLVIKEEMRLEEELELLRQSM